MGNQMMISIVRFYLWSLVTLICFFIMLFLSFMVHGIILTDYLKTNANFSNLDEVDFYTIVVLLYFILAAILTVIFKIFLKKSTRPVVHGAMVGIAFGILVFTILKLSGLPLFKNNELGHNAFNLFWQLLEQGIGGMVIGYIYKILHNHQTKKYGLIRFKRRDQGS